MWPLKIKFSVAVNSPLWLWHSLCHRPGTATSQAVAGSGILRVLCEVVTGHYVKVGRIQGDPGNLEMVQDGGLGKHYVYCIPGSH